MNPMVVLIGLLLYTVYRGYMVCSQVLCVVVLITASISKERIEEVDDFDPFDDDRDRYGAVSGWMIFVSVMGIVTEGFIVVSRFLNLSIVNKNFALIGVMVRFYT